MTLDFVLKCLLFSVFLLVASKNTAPWFCCCKVFPNWNGKYRKIILPNRPGPDFGFQGPGLNHSEEGGWKFSRMVNPKFGGENPASYVFSWSPEWCTGFDWKLLVLLFWDGFWGCMFTCFFLLRLMRGLKLFLKFQEPFFSEKVDFLSEIKPGRFSF